MKSDWDTHSDDSLLSVFKLEDRSGRSTPESHWGCPGYGHGQGAPVYSCGCYKHNVLKWFKPELSPPENEQVFQLTDKLQLGAEQPEQQLETPSRDGNLEDADKSRVKRKRSEDDNTMRNFGHDITNMQATSAPLIELPPKKRKKIGRHIELFEGELLAKVMQEFVGIYRTTQPSRVSLAATRTGTQKSAIVASCDSNATPSEEHIVDCFCMGPNVPFHVGLLRLQTDQRKASRP
ncbi:hypothetical protein F4604DRAFT_1933812 [Suillus subluteus]|nr:hypothetical protein F4604DRAFT_1933812 [Suillus subluteus]